MEEIKRIMGITSHCYISPDQDDRDDSGFSKPLLGGVGGVRLNHVSAQLAMTVNDLTIWIVNLMLLC